MKRSLALSVALLMIVGSVAEAQRGQRGGQRGNQQRGNQNQQQRGNPQGATGSRRGQDGIGDSNPLAIGDSGVAWYTTWGTGLEEAQRSNRPIFFMSAATTCSGVPGVF